MSKTSFTRSPQNTLFVIFAFFGSIINLLLGLIFTLVSISINFSDVGEGLPSPVWWATAFGFLALCGLPSIFFGVRVLLNGEDIPKIPLKYSYLLAIPIFLSGLFVGYLAFSRGIFPLVLGPVAKIIATSSAALFVIQLVRRFGPELSKRRIWGQLILGLWVVPIFALVSEFLILIPTLFLFVLGALTSENGRFLLDLLSESSSPSVSAITEAANSIVMEPWFIALLLGFFAVLVPLIEETLKTIVVWPWIVRRRTSAEAFLGGVIGGAGYSMFEAIFLTQAESTWLPTMVGRAGATIMHSFTTGVASWGLAEGIRKKRWGRMLLSSLLAVTLHGLWNAGAVSIAIIEVREFQTSDLATSLRVVQGLIPIMIIALVLIALIGLSQFSKRLHSSIDEPGLVDLSQEGI